MADRSVVVRLRAEIAGYRAAMSQAATATRNAARDMSREMATSARANEQAFNQAGTALTAFGTITVGALGLAVKAAIDWESAWTGVLKTVDGSDKQLAGLEDGLRNLARTMPATHEEIAATAEAAGQLGIKTDDILGFTKVMIDLGNTTNLSADEAATSIAQLMNVMQTAPEDVDNLGAALVALGNNGASTERDIVQMAQRIAGAGAIVGASEADILGLANAVASVGIQVEAGGSAVSRILTDMAKAVSTGGKDLAGFAEAAGMSSDQFVKAFEDDPVAAFASFTEGLGRIDAAGGDVFTTLDDLGQSDIRVSRALLTMAKSGTLLRDSLELGNEAWEANTALLEEAEKRYATTESKIKGAKGSIEDAAITMGQTFLPVIADIATQVGDAANAFGRLPQPIQATIGVTTLLVGGTALLAGGFLLLMPRIVATRAAFTTLSTSMVRTTAAARLAAATIAGIGTAALVTIAATVAAGKAFDAMISDDATPKANKLSAAIKDVAESGKPIGDLGGQFANFGKVLGMQSGAVEGLAGSFDALLAPSNAQKFQGFIGNIPGMTSNVERAEERVKGLDAALVSMVQAGDTESVMGFQAALMDMGYSAEQINELLPGTVDAMLAVEETAEPAAAANVRVANSFGEVKEMSEEAAEALQEWQEKVRATSAAFIDPSGAYAAAIQSQIDANTAYAESTVEATGEAADSWEDYYDGVSVSMGQLLEQQQKQLTDQVNYNANMIKLAGSVSEEYLTYLQGLGTEAAPLIAELANALPEELAASDAMFVQGQNAATEYVDAMQAVTDGREVTVTVNADGTLAYTVAEETLSAVDSMAVKPWALGVDPTPAIDTAANSTIPLLSGMTVEPWDLSARPENAMSTGRQTSTSIGGMTPSAWAIDAKADPAIAEANKAKNEIDGKTASIKVTAVRAEGFLGAVQGMAATVAATFAPLSVRPIKPAERATGGSVFGAGTETSDSIPALLSNNEHVWTAKEVRGAGGHGAVERLRAQAASGALPRFATGGAVGLWERRAQQAWSQAQAAWNRGDDAGWRAADDRYKAAQDAIKTLSAERISVRSSVSRGQITGQATSGLSGAFSVVDQLRDGSRDDRYTSTQRENFRKTANESELAMKRLYAQTEKVEKSLEAARDRAKELADVKASVSGVLSGEFTLGGMLGQQDQYGYDKAVTSKSLVTGALAKGDQIKAFSKKLDRLRALGLSGAVLQEVAQLGTAEGTLVADALIAGGKGDIRALNDATTRIGAWSDRAGQNVTEGFYKGGVEAANGLVKGLESQQAAIEKQILKIAQGMEKALKRALGIASPSKVTTSIGEFTGEGVIVGMRRKRRGIEDEATAMGLAAVPGLPAGVDASSVNALQGWGRGASVAPPVVDLSGIERALDGMTVLVDVGLDRPTQARIVRQGIQEVSRTDRPILKKAVGV